jgi:hypothetical protein
LALLGRIVVIMFAVFVASLAAGIAIAVGLLGPRWQVFGGDVVDRSVFSVFVVFGASFTSAAIFLPLLILIAMAEALRIRSIVAYLAAGALLLVIAYQASGLAPPSYQESIDHPSPPIPHDTEIAAAAGALFGLAYWLIAGRNAGRWRNG